MKKVGVQGYNIQERSEQGYSAFRFQPLRRRAKSPYILVDHVHSPVHSSGLSQGKRYERSAS